MTLGCIRKLGCLVVLLVLAVALFVARARWRPLIRGSRAPANAASTEGVWEPVTPAAAERARVAIAGLEPEDARAWGDTAVWMGRPG